MKPKLTKVEIEHSQSDYQEEYSEKGFWAKLASFAITAGKEFVEKALYLFYAAQRPETPVWAKAIIYSALGYFILPTDAIPDLTPAVGFSDDLGALTLAVAAVAVYINKEVKDKAKSKIKHWFGE